MPILQGSSPDLVFYYSLALPSSVINQTVNKTDVNQLTSGIIFADEEFNNPIGKFAFNISAFNVVNNDGNETSQKLYEVTGTNVYFLPQGTISNSINVVFIKDSQGNFVVPGGKQLVYQILSGSGNFLQAKGFVVQITSDNLSRKMLVYFDK